MRNDIHTIYMNSSYRPKYLCLGLVFLYDLAVRQFCLCYDGFYRAMLCIRGTSHGPVSVRLSVCVCLSVSVTSRSSTKTAKRRITQTKPHDSAGTLVF